MHVSEIWWKQLSPVLWWANQKDKELRNIIRQHGYPPMWTRPNSFQTLILTILEQQVSLAAAYAAFKKLKEKIGHVTPQKILQLSDEEMRACYFTRQKWGMPAIWLKQ